MTRSGIYVGDKEIIARYIGNKIVWAKRLNYQTIYTNVQNIYKNSDRTLTFQAVRKIHHKKIPRAVLNGKKVPATEITASDGFNVYMVFANEKKLKQFIQEIGGDSYSTQLYSVNVQLQV